MKVDCEHNWAHGYLGDMLVFCTKCNKDADEVYKNMPYKDQCKLVNE